MLVLLSPAKSLDMQATLASCQRTEPRLAAHTRQLAKIMKAKSIGELKQLMGISDKLAALNYQRYQDFMPSHTACNSAPALAAFNGDVYEGLQARSLSADELEYAQDHVRILSGLYGLLRPLDAMQPYRLEMGTKLATDKGEDLYDFWGETITRLIESDADTAGASAIVNLASNEYAKAVHFKALSRRVITPVFKERRNGTTKIVSFYAKKARGTMARWILQHRIETADALTSFAEDGYRLEAANEQKGELVFVRG